MSNQEKTILLCVTGMTPQIITETLYALLVEQKESVDEIRVITTLEGRDKIVEKLLDKEKGKFFEFCREYKIDAEKIKFDETSIALLHTRDRRTLNDIRTIEDNEQAADQICEIVRELTRDENIRLYASVAGGRKTMGVYLANAMQLFGRVNDRLSHVLVSKEFESHTHFFYKPKKPKKLETKNENKISTDDAEIYLADIPFIRLRGIIKGWEEPDSLSYSELVENAQSNLDLLESFQEIEINLKKKTVMIGNRKAKLTERQFFFYVLFARLRQNEEKKWKLSVPEFTAELLNENLMFITEARGERQTVDDYSSSRFDFVKTYHQRLANRKGIDIEEVAGAFTEAISKMGGKFAKEKIPLEFSIQSFGSRGDTRYGLNVPPRSIKFIK